MTERTNLLIAAIDIGSSAIRMDIAEAKSEGTLRILESLKRGVQLGREAFSQGNFSQDTIRAACGTLKDFKRVLDTYGVASYRAVATSAAREAGNSETFLDRLLVSSGLEVEIINGAEENQLTLLAVMQSLQESSEIESGKCLMVEVGGGSTDVSLIEEGELLQSGTFPLGSIRLSTGASTGPVNHQQHIQLLKQQIKSLLPSIKRDIGFANTMHCIALGGDVRFAARMLAESNASDNLVSIPRGDFRNFVGTLSQMTEDKIVQEYSISYLDAETLVPALLTYLQLLEETQATQITVCNANIRTGILLDMIPFEKGERLERSRFQILSAARSLGKKYQYDPKHAERVRKLASIIFDEIRNEQHLTETDRLYLEIAALLHDIGLYISPRAHHKHSHYLIASSELFGLRKQEMDLIANIARYHRKALPQRSHIPFIALDRDERVTVSKLAAILRVANALDKDHLESPLDLKTAREGDQVLLLVPNLSDLTMAKLALAGRSNLFLEVFGKKIALKETEGIS